MKQKISCTIDPSIVRWVSDFWGDSLSRSAAIETCLLAFRQIVEALVEVTATDDVRAVAAVRSFQAGVVPTTVDLEALARTFKERAKEATP